MAGRTWDQKAHGNCWQVEITHSHLSHHWHRQGMTGLDIEAHLVAGHGWRGGCGDASLPFFWPGSVCK